MERRDEGRQVNRTEQDSGQSVRHLADGAVRPSMTTTVRDVMRAPLPGVDGSEPVMAAARRLRAHALAAVPVHGVGGEFLGMLTAADIIDRCVADGQDPRAMLCWSLIDGAPVFVTPEEVFGSRILGVMLAQPFPMLPVVGAEGRLIGMLTVDDVAGYLLEAEHVDDTSFEPEDR